MKKIAILYPAHYEQSSGGAEIQILYLINACKQQNWEIHYIFEDKGTDIKNKDINHDTVSGCFEKNPAYMKMEVDYFKIFFNKNGDKIICLI